jgi:hypothetical protein
LTAKNYFFPGDIDKYKMLYYQHGDEPDKLVEATESYLKKGFLMSTSTAGSIKFTDDTVKKLRAKRIALEAIDSTSAKLLEKEDSIQSMSGYYAKEFVSILQPYLTFVTAPNAFKKAETWSKRLIELKENAQYLSIHAQILFKAGDKTEGIAAQKKAIELAKTEKLNEKELSDLQEILKKMED